MCNYQFKGTTYEEIEKEKNKLITELRQSAENKKIETNAKLIKLKNDVLEKRKKLFKLKESIPENVSIKIDNFRKQFIKSAILSKDTYSLTELYDEYNKLIDFLVNHCPYIEAQTISDIIELLDEYENHKATSMLKSLIRQHNIYKSGIDGENKTFKAISVMDDEVKILRNCRFSVDDLDCEIDLIIIAPQGLFAIEVKNSRTSITITESGMLYDTENNIFKGNLAEQIQRHSNCIRRLLKNIKINNIPIISVLVFSNDKTQFENNYKYIKTCYRYELEHIIRKDIDNIFLKPRDIDSIQKKLELENLSAKKHIPTLDDKTKFDIKEFINLYCKALKNALIEKQKCEIQIKLENFENESKNKINKTEKILKSIDKDLKYQIDGLNESADEAKNELWEKTKTAKVLNGIGGAIKIAKKIIDITSK